MTSFEILQLFAGFIGSLGFAILFNIRDKKLIAAAFGGFLSWLIFVLLEFIVSSEPIRYFFVSVIISVYAEIMARLIKTPVTTFLMTSLIPLIPGGSFYNTMVSFFSGISEDFFNKAIYTLSLAIALALGIVMTTAFTKITIRLKEKIICRQ